MLDALDDALATSLEKLTSSEMKREDVFQRIGTVIGESAIEDVDWASATGETTIESFGFDSLAVLDLLFDLEGEFGVEISAKEILNIRTLGELVTFLEERVAS
ncbi:MAG: acyl carrier protein [Thermoanaerobaculia bacterium]